MASAMLERLRVMLDPADPAEHAAVDELARLDEQTLARLYRMIGRESRRPIIFVQSDDDDVGGYHEQDDE